MPPIQPALARVWANKSLSIVHGTSAAAGTIALEADSRPEANGKRLTVVNSDRTWSLTAADGEPQAALWASMVAIQCDKLKARPLSQASNAVPVPHLAENRECAFCKFGLSSSRLSNRFATYTLYPLSAIHLIRQSPEPAPTTDAS